MGVHHRPKKPGRLFSFSLPGLEEDASLPETGRWNRTASGRVQPVDDRANRNESVVSPPVLHIEVYRMDALAQCDLGHAGLEEATFLGRQVDDPVPAGQLPTSRMCLQLLDNMTVQEPIETLPSRCRPLPGGTGCPKTVNRDDAPLASMSSNFRVCGWSASREQWHS